jgi:hypothetical protein
MHDIIWFFIDALDLYRVLQHDLQSCTGVVPSPRRHHHEASGNVTQLTMLTISHHMPPLQNKVRRFYFIFCMFYVVSRAFAQEPFLTYEHETTTLIYRLLLWVPLRDLRCRRHIHYSWRNRHPTSHFYTVQVVCQSWNQSHVKCIRSVTGRFNPTMP